MLSLLLMSVLGAGDPNMCPMGSVCAKGDRTATATITFSLNLVSSEHMAMVAEPLFPEMEVAAYHYLVRTTTTGMADAATIDREFLVLDDRIAGSDQFAFIMIENQLTHTPDPQVLVMEWSESNERLVRGIVYDRAIHRDLIAFTKLKKPVYNTTTLYYE